MDVVFIQKKSGCWQLWFRKSTRRHVKQELSRGAGADILPRGAPDTTARDTVSNGAEI